MTNPAAMDDAALAEALEAAPEGEPTLEVEAENPEQPKPEPANKDVAPEAGEKQPTSEDEKSAEQPDVAELQAKLANMEKRLRDKDSHIGKQKNELEKVKSQLSQIQVPPKPTDEDFSLNPADAHEQMDAHKKAASEKQQLEHHKQMLEQMDLNRSTVIGAVPEFDDSLPEIGKVLVEEDNLDPNLVTNFLSNPFSADPVALIQMAKRAKTRTELADLRAKNEELTKQVESLKQKPGKILDKLDRATRNGPPVSSEKGRSTPKPTDTDMNSAQRAEMSYDALSDALKNANDNEE